MSLATEATKTRKPKNQQPAAEQAAEPAAEQTAMPQPTKPKSKMSRAEKMASLSEEDRKAARAKAAEASKRAKMKKGTTPEQSAVARLEAKLHRNQEQAKSLDLDRDAIMAALEEARANLAAKQGEVASA
jgi:hypothetical protein